MDVSSLVNTRTMPFSLYRALRVLMQTKSNPTIVIVHGAWHGPSHYEELSSRLENQGFSVVLPSLPSTGSEDRRDVTMDTDADYIRDTVLIPLVEAGKKVVIVAHSYGACPASGAAHDLSLVERKLNGKVGGIIGMLFIASFLANEGDILIDKMPLEQTQSWVTVNEKSGRMIVRRPKDIFYSDVSSPSVVRKAIEGLRTQSCASLASPALAPAWSAPAFNGRRIYLYTFRDTCIPLLTQRTMVQSSGVVWEEKGIDSGHSPFLSRPDELTDIIVLAVDKWK